MYLPVAFCITALASLRTATAIERRATPSLYLVGDSTTAFHSVSAGIQGWGVEIPQFLQDIRVVNLAISGSSARSYTSNGNWTTVKDRLASGDYVVIEFGHNDGGSPESSDRADVYGDDDSVTQTVTLANGAVEVVHTFGYYIKAMIDDSKAKGANVIISSQTPDNPYDNSTTIVDAPPRFVGYAKDVAAAKGVPYVDHFAAVIALFTKLGNKTVDSYYPFDHTHTNVAGAIQVAQAFLGGLSCSSAQGVLAEYVKAGEATNTTC